MLERNSAGSSNAAAGGGGISGDEGGGDIADRSVTRSRNHEVEGLLCKIRAPYPRNRERDSTTVLNSDGVHVSWPMRTTSFSELASSSEARSWDVVSYARRALAC